MFDVTLAAGKHTEVYFADGIKALSTQLSAYGQNVLWVFDANSAALFRDLPEKKIILPPGEQNKNWVTLNKIFSAALDFGLARDSVFIGFGGGVICDMTALAASLYMRGCALVLVPTTLLCMVDASVGGKSAIDFQGGKNLVGSFYPARDVLICSDTLRTLPENEYLCGLGEVVKHAFLSADERLFKFLEENKDAVLKRDKAAVSEMVRLSVEVKISFIERDPEERKGIRSFLNLGHTFAHALEATGKFKNFSHGKAVAWGCAKAFELGSLMKITPSEVRKKGIALLSAYGFDVSYRIGRGEWIDFYQAMLKDKKKYQGKVKFVLLEDMGKPALFDVEPALVQSVVIESPVRSGRN